MFLTLMLAIGLWQDFGYNRRQQARQCVMIVLGSAVTAWIFALL